jgi:autotransporter-associated beta strand protein
MRAYSLNALSVAASLAAAALSGTMPSRADVVVDVSTGTTDLTSLGATDNSDVTFTNQTYSPTAFTANTSVAFGSLDDLDTTQPLTITNQSSTSTSTITLGGGGGDSVPGSSSSDLIYIPAGASLAINGAAIAGQSTEQMYLNMANAGNFDVAGSLAINAAIIGSAPITIAGGGTVSYGPSPASSANDNANFTGNTTIANGTLILAGATNAPNTAFGASSSTVFFGNSSSNVTLQYNITSSTATPNFIVGGTGVDTIINNSGSPTAGNAAVFSSSNTITLENNLVVSNTIAQSTINDNILSYRGLIKQSGGSYGITVASTNVGCVDFRGNNTFTGNFVIDSGQVSFNLGSTGANGSITGGPFGEGTLILAGVANPSAPVTLTDASSYTINNTLDVGTLADAGTSTVTIEETGTSSAGVIGGPVVLNEPLILTAASGTAGGGNGGDRLRIGAGGITGSYNLILNNPNYTLTGLTTRDPISLTGNSSPTAWTGNLIIEAGDGAIISPSGANGLNSIGANNTVELGSGSSIDVCSTVGGGGPFSPTIAGLQDFNSPTTPGVVYYSQTSNITLTLAGSGSYSFSGTIQNSSNTSGNLALNVGLQPGAAQSLAGASSYSGGTKVASGTLALINLTGSATGTGAVSVSNGATLTGTGNVSGAVTVANTSTIAPGNNTSGDLGAVGTLSLGTGASGGLTLTSAAMDYDLAASASANSDLVETNGTLTLGAVSFTFNELAGSLDTSPADSYTLISGVTTFSGALPTTATFQNGRAYIPTFFMNGSNLDVSFTPVPEPAAAAAIPLIGVISLLLSRRRARSKA